MPRKRNPANDMLPTMGETQQPQPETTEALLSETRLETSPDMPDVIADLTLRNTHPLMPELTII